MRKKGRHEGKKEARNAGGGKERKKGTQEGRKRGRKAEGTEGRKQVRENGRKEGRKQGTQEDKKQGRNEGRQDKARKKGRPEGRTTQEGSKERKKEGYYCYHCCCYCYYYYYYYYYYCCCWYYYYYYDYYYYYYYYYSYYYYYYHYYYYYYYYYIHHHHHDDDYYNHYYYHYHYHYRLAVDNNATKVLVQRWDNVYVLVHAQARGSWVAPCFKMSPQAEVEHWCGILVNATHDRKQEVLLRIPLYSQYIPQHTLQEIVAAAASNMEYYGNLVMTPETAADLPRNFGAVSILPLAVAAEYLHVGTKKASSIHLRCFYGRASFAPAQGCCLGPVRRQRSKLLVSTALVGDTDRRP